MEAWRRKLYNSRVIIHYGVSKLDGAPGRGSGRYPLGSGKKNGKLTDHSIVNQPLFHPFVKDKDIINARNEHKKRRDRYNNTGSALQQEFIYNKHFNPEKNKTFLEDHAELIDQMKEDLNAMAMLEKTCRLRTKEERKKIRRLAAIGEPWARKIIAAKYNLDT